MTTDMFDILDAAWGWTGLQATEVVGDNPFGNLMIRASDGRFWRLCPEDLYCQVIADDRAALDELAHDQTFLQDWYMEAMVEKAQHQLGPLDEGRKYCLKIPGVLGGEYGGDNLATIDLCELIRASGDIARQIAELPDGAQVRLTVTD
jgi:hypothetical protein